MGMGDTGSIIDAADADAAITVFVAIAALFVLPSMNDYILYALIVRKIFANLNVGTALLAFPIVFFCSAPAVSAAAAVAFLQVLIWVRDILPVAFFLKKPLMIFAV